MQVLKPRIIKPSRNVVNFKVNQINKRTLEITFDFLDQNDGAIIEIFHTGTRNVKFNVVGTIKGVPSGISNMGQIEGDVLEPPSRQKTLEKIIMYCFSVLFLSLSIFLLGSSLLKILGISKVTWIKPETKWYQFLGIIIIGLGSLIPPILLAPGMRKKVPKNLIP